MFWGILGSACLLYFIVICFYAGAGSAFSWFWAMGGAVGIALGVFWQKMPDKLQKGIWGLFIAALAVLVIMEGKILYYANQKPQKEADYMIVLGCQIRGTKVSRSLRYRLEAAKEYAEENPAVKMIVSGGQGFGEDISEAEAMKGWLVEKGIEADRIYAEDKSTNTYENMKFSREFIESQGRSAKDTKVVVVSNGFHICRAMKLGKKQGFEHLEGLAGKTDKILAVSYYIREALALMKDSVVGNL